jgi:CubicO group peptidase (beta-lactamase class C family)
MRKYFISITLALALLTATLTQTSVTGSPDQLNEKVDKLFSQWDKPDSPGCALGVIKDGKFVYKRGYGSANLDYNVPLSSESVFYIASTFANTSPSFPGMKLRSRSTI